MEVQDLLLDRESPLARDGEGAVHKNGDWDVDEEVEEVECVQLRILGKDRHCVWQVGCAIASGSTPYHAILYSVFLDNIDDEDEKQ